MIAADGRHHQDRVRLLRVQRAVRDVGDREVLDHLPALQREVADPVLLVRRLVGSVGERDRDVEQQAGDDGGDECTAHDSLLVSSGGASLETAGEQ